MPQTVRDIARLSAEEVAPNLNLVEWSRVRGKVVVCDFPIPTLTETLPVLSPGTVPAVVGELPHPIYKLPVTVAD